MSTDATIPEVIISFKFTALTMNGFSRDLQLALAQALLDSLPADANVQVTFANTRPDQTSGSVLVDVEVDFLDGDLVEAELLASIVQSAVRPCSECDMK